MLLLLQIGAHQAHRCHSALSCCCGSDGRYCGADWEDLNVNPWNSSDEGSAPYGLSTDKIRHSTQFRPWWKQERQDQ